VNTEAADLALAPLLLGIEDGDGRPLLVRHASRQCLRSRMRRDRDPAARGRSDDRPARD
jgi:hypothetical protein